jgi:hypothetical protein
VLQGDESIVNCLQPHPSYCFLATSGIDPVVRLWNPRPEVRVQAKQPKPNKKEKLGTLCEPLAESEMRNEPYRLEAAGVTKANSKWETYSPSPIPGMLQMQ